MHNVYTYSKRVAIGALITLLLLSAFYMLGKHGYFFLLVFASILLAVLFCGITDFLVSKLRLKRGLSLLLAVLIFFGSLVAAFYFLAPTVSQQIGEMQQTVPKAVERVEGWLANYGWGQKLAQKVPDDVSKMMPKQQTLLSQVSKVFSSTLSLLADIAIVVVTAIFFAAHPQLYTVGFSKLFAVRHRSRIVQVLGECYSTLKKWLLAMLLAMTIIGISTAIGLKLLGMPLAFALAFFAFLFAFVPNVGPWVAAIPMGLVGLTQSPQLAMYALLVYAGIQFLESYVITPLIFQKTVDLPPALLLFFQVLLGILQGALGLLLAAPILAVLMVVINELYITDLLEGKPVDASKEPLPEA